MTGERTVYALMLLLALTLPASALLQRRIAIASALRLGLIWLLIIAGLVLVVKVLRLDRPQDYRPDTPQPAAYFT